MTQQDYADRLTLALDAAKMGLWDWDLATNQVTWNDHHEIILGYQPGQSVRSLAEWANRVHPDDLPHVSELVQTALAEQSDYHYEYRLQLPDGTVRWVSGYGRGYYDADGKPLRMVGVLLDITARKQSELADQKHTEELDWKNRLLTQTTALLRRRNEELDRFAHVVSHDLKAPLRAIANLSEWIEEDLGGQVPAQSQKQLRLLKQRVHRMEALINDLLAYSRAGKIQTQPEAIALKPLLQEIIDSLAPPPEFSIVIKPDMPTFTTRRVPLTQVLYNLISNAIKHHDQPDGSITVSVTDQGQQYEFSITDNGPGIEPKHHERIFEVFQTVEPRVQHPHGKSESSGMGLAIVKKIIDAEGGRIWIESDLGRGAAFYFSWPKQAQTDMD